MATGGNTGGNSAGLGATRTLADLREETGVEGGSLNEELREELRGIRANNLCFDCATPLAPGNTWASVTFGVCICTKCAGMHRGFGVHVSYVRSLDLDDLQPQQALVLRVGGNLRAYANMSQFPAKEGITFEELYAKYKSDAAKNYLATLQEDVSARAAAAQPASGSSAVLSRQASGDLSRQNSGPLPCYAGPNQASLCRTAALAPSLEVLQYDIQTGKLMPVIDLQFLQIVDVVSGQDFYGAVTYSGKVWMWGVDRHSRLGSGKQNDTCDSLRGVSAVSSAMLAANTVTLPPFELSIPVPIIQLAVGDTHCLALANNRSVFSWGNGFGYRLGHGDEEDVLSPKLIAAIPHTILQVACGDTHSMALSMDGKLFAWGSSFSGAVGHHSKELIYPEDLAYLGDYFGTSPVVYVACGNSFTIALNYDGEVYAWGDNYFGNLGKSRSNSPTTYPVRVPLDHIITQVACGQCHSMLLTDTGMVLGSGSNLHGQIGVPNTDRSHGEMHVLAHVDTVPAGVTTIGTGRFSSYFLVGMERVMWVCGKDLDPCSRGQSDLFRPRPLAELDEQMVMRATINEAHITVAVGSGSVGSLAFDLEQLLREGEYSDLHLLHGSAAVLKVHKAVLSCRCPTLLSLCALVWESISDDCHQVSMEPREDSLSGWSELISASAECLAALFQFLYTDDLPSSALSHDDSCVLRALASALNLTRLSECLQGSFASGQEGTLGQDLSRLLESREYSDFSLSVTNGDDPSQPPSAIPVHKFLLHARSEYFRSLFSSGMSESTFGMVVLDMPVSVAQLMCRYLYTDTVEDDSAQCPAPRRKTVARPPPLQREPSDDSDGSDWLPKSVTKVFSKFGFGRVARKGKSRRDHTRKKSIPKPRGDEESEDALSYEYDIDGYGLQTLVDGMGVADQYQLTHMLSLCSQAVCRQVCAATAADLLNIAEIYSAAQLKHACLDTLAREYSACSKTEGFGALNQSSLREILVVRRALGFAETENDGTGLQRQRSLSE